MFVNSGGWAIDVGGLLNGNYRVYLYAASNGVVPTGALTVQGISVRGIPGDVDSNLIEGTSWVGVDVKILDGSLSISGQDASFNGLAGIQIVPIVQESLNIDFGIARGIPSTSFGGAADQPGTWNGIAAGMTALDDLAGNLSGVSLNLVADWPGGSTSSVSRRATIA